jgi:hypothetical protein
MTHASPRFLASSVANISTKGATTLLSSERGAARARDLADHVPRDLWVMDVTGSSMSPSAVTAIEFTFDERATLYTAE